MSRARPTSSIGTFVRRFREWREPPWPLDPWTQLNRSYQVWWAAALFGQVVIASAVLAFAPDMWAGFDVRVALLGGGIAFLLLLSIHRSSEEANWDTPTLVAAALIFSGHAGEAFVAVICANAGYMLRKPLVWHLAAANVANGLLGVVVGHAVFSHWAGTGPSFGAGWLAGAAGAFVAWAVIDLVAFVPAQRFLGLGDVSAGIRHWLDATRSLLTSMAPVAILVGYAMDEKSYWYVVLLAVPQLILHDVFRRSEQLVESEVANRRLRGQFSRYVPEAVVEQLVAEGQEIELGGEQREISVLFCDIRGFTSWSEHLPPTQIVVELNGLLGELSDCVFETGGTLDKFTGDGLMAFWGAPLEQPDHARRACDTAMMMVERLAAFNEQMGCDFKIGIGIHSGAAVVGNIGHGERHDYTAIGDTVNLSARIEAATKDHDAALLVSQHTYAALAEDTRERFHDVGAIAVKGRAQLVRVHRLVLDAAPRELHAEAG